MLVTLRDVLQPARTGHYAVPAFDFVGDLMGRTILETAESLAAPVILMTLEADLDSGAGAGWVYQVAMARAAAAYHAIPVVLHLDHVTDLKQIRKALDLGYTSVMIDGSRLPFEENVALTKAAVELARPQGVSVEAELGRTAGRNVDGVPDAGHLLTDPDELSRFIELTGVDAVAVSIGTSHGAYRRCPNCTWTGCGAARPARYRWFCTGARVRIATSCRRRSATASARSTCTATCGSPWPAG